MLNQLKRHWLRYLVHIGCLVPFGLLIIDYLNDQLTVNPIQAATLRTGKTALIILVLSLVCTPIKTFTPFKQVTALRRPLGLYAFFYVCLHLLIFVAWDYGFDWEFIGEAIGEKRYIIVGLIAWLLLIPLAITSTKGWMRRLGKRWRLLHRLVYLIAGLAVLHYVWLVKADVREPLLYGLAIVILLLLRLPAFRRWQQRQHKQPKPLDRSTETS
ncbi:protein-methionine-sulfoxide reductase heme-binding subunit MsrQ [Herpetosiphon geysericola]|uniref:Protein-methionine-sulfoxide reductase heme-binding subunit MsrQ n=1 Tax=Herpetosiphon geysericola TaxID=70996 RepID=A0A0P6YDH6_9CHLR|nr:protein-methionine-sulfoxide reductase heme-binding subunit MsrQ [Herpetosiphon geysericola]KPL90110.1 iron reductase [Herpetosiphon geysericola]